MISRRSFAGQVVAAAVAASPMTALAQVKATPPLSDAEKEKFLVSARIVSAAEIGHGVTKPVKVQMMLDGVKHDAKVQVVNKDLPYFFGPDKKPIPMRDSWACNVAAYKMDRLLGLNMVTVEVARPYKGKPGAFSWWVDDVMFEEVERLKKDLTAPDPEDFARQRALVGVFDELIMNIDRNLANLLITKSWKIALIDHTRSFTAYHGIRNDENLTRCSRKLMESMKNLNSDAIGKATEAQLSAVEREAILHRRDRIIEFFQKRASEKGEQNVFFD